MSVLHSCNRDHSQTGNKHHKTIEEIKEEALNKYKGQKYVQEPHLIEKLMAELGVLSETAKTAGNEAKSKEYEEYIKYLQGLDTTINK